MNFLNMMKQAQQMKKSLAEAEKKVNALLASGESGGGIVKITLNGNGSMNNLIIDKNSLASIEHDMLEDLIKSAYHEAWSILEKQKEQIMSSATGGMKLPF